VSERGGGSLGGGGSAHAPGAHRLQGALNAVQCCQGPWPWPLPCVTVAGSLMRQWTGT
jgi:hypothetical protein